MNDFSNIPPLGSASHQNDENRLTSEDYEAFREAVDILYIKGNASGRLKFLENWPAAASLIFGDELIGFDKDGASDLDRRAVLEDEAEGRRLGMLDIVETFEGRSVYKGALQVEYVEMLVKKLGRDVALSLYSPKIVDRFIAPPLPTDETVEETTQPPVVKPQEAEKPVEKSVEAVVPDPFEEKVVHKPAIPDFADEMDTIEPITIEPPVKVTSPQPAVTSEAAKKPEVETPQIFRKDIASQKPAAKQAQSQPAKEPTPDAQNVKPDMPPVSPDPVRQEAVKQSVHKALDGAEPVASQKMTFAPPKPEGDGVKTPEKKDVPVIFTKSD